MKVLLGVVLIVLALTGKVLAANSASGPFGPEPGSNYSPTMKGFVSAELFERRGDGKVYWAILPNNKRGEAFFDRRERLFGWKSIIGFATTLPTVVPDTESSVKLSTMTRAGYVPRTDKPGEFLCGTEVNVETGAVTKWFTSNKSRAGLYTVLGGFRVVLALVGNWLRRLDTSTWYGWAGNALGHVLQPTFTALEIRAIKHNRDLIREIGRSKEKTCPTS